MRLFIFLFAILLIGNVACAQLFHSEKKLQPAARATYKLSINPASLDSLLNAVRFTAIALYAEPNNIACAGVGLAYQHQKFDVANMRWQSQYSVGLYAVAGGSVAPKTPTDVVSVTALFGFLNDVIRIGPMYNFKSGWGFAVAFGANFNN